MTNQSLMTPFWPSRRLWVKSFIGLIYAPLLFLLLFRLFIQAVFLQGLYLVLFCLIFVGGPISIGLLLLPSRRGVGAGLITAIAIPAIWYFAGAAIDTFSFIDNDLQLGVSLVAATVVALLELTTGDVRGQAQIIGLGIGLAVGLFLVFVDTSLVGPFHYKGNDELMFLSLYPPNALVWLNALFFPEWVSRKVGWGGGIVWIVLTSLVFGLSLMLMK